MDYLFYTKGHLEKSSKETTSPFSLADDDSLFWEICPKITWCVDGKGLAEARGWIIGVLEMAFSGPGSILACSALRAV